MILHHVYLCLRPDHSVQELAAVMSSLSALPLEGFLGFEHGPNIDLERKSQDFTYGFQCRFTDQAALKCYAADPGHQALGARLVALCEGGADGIIVFDLNCAGTA